MTEFGLGNSPPLVVHMDLLEVDRDRADEQPEAVETPVVESGGEVSAVVARGDWLCREFSSRY